MARDLSLKAIKKNGKFIRCELCKKHNAVERFKGLYVCRKCFRPLMYGFLIGKMIED